MALFSLISNTFLPQSEKINPIPFLIPVESKAYWV